MLSMRPGGKMNGVIISPLLVTTPNSMMSTGCLLFINMTINLFLVWLLNLRIGTYALNARHYSIPFRNCFSHRLCSIDSSLLHRKQSRIQIKQMRDINNSKYHNLPIVLCIWQPNLYTTILILMIFSFQLWVDSRVDRVL